MVGEGAFDMIIYYVLDTETTGLKAGYHEVNQISVLRLDDGEQITVDIAVEHPSRASQEALNVQGKSRLEICSGIRPAQAVDRVSKFLEGDEHTPAHRCIVGHNVQFDRKFCWQMWDDAQRIFPADLWLCTKTFAQRYAKKTGPQKIAQAQNQPKAKFGLNMFMGGVGLVPKEGAHSAEVDVKNTATLLQFLWDSKMDYVSLIKRMPHHEEEQTGRTEWVDFE
jgi:DNA polymerase III epsilon subunit-like protein